MKSNNVFKEFYDFNQELPPFASKKILFECFTSYEKYAIKDGKIFGEKEIDKKYAIVNNKKLFLYFVNIGKKLFDCIDKDKISQINCYDTNFYTSTYDINIALFAINNETVNILTDLCNDIGLPIYNENDIIIDSHIYNLSNDINYITSACIIIYLIYELVENIYIYRDSKTYIEQKKIIMKIFSMKIFDKKEIFNIFIKILNKIHYMFDENSESLKYKILNKKKIIPIQVSNSLFYFAWIETRRMMINFMIRDYYDDYATLQTISCNNCGKEIDNIIETYDIKTKKYYIQKTTKRLCDDCKKENIEKSKKKSLRNIQIMYDLIKKNIEKSGNTQMINKFKKIKRGHNFKELKKMAKTLKIES